MKLINRHGKDWKTLQDTNGPTPRKNNNIEDIIYLFK
jgi:hypothetical protein